MERVCYVQAQRHGILQSHQPCFPGPTQPTKSKQIMLLDLPMLIIIWNICKSKMAKVCFLYHACSQTSSFGELKSFTKLGMAPVLTTSMVCSEVPEAMLVRALVPQTAATTKQEKISSRFNINNSELTPHNRPFPSM